MPKYFDTDNCRPRIIFHTAVWCKLFALVQNTNTECAISGFVYKKDNDYTVFDVSVYPQIVKAAEVVIDEDLYAPWLLQFTDEKIKMMRFQAHSHVRMGTTPSPQDLSTWLDLTKLAKDYFIFMIINKSNEFSLFLYDCEKRLIFEKGDLDIDYKLPGNQGTVSDWYNKDCAKMLKVPETTKTVTPKTTVAPATPTSLTVVSPPCEDAYPSDDTPPWYYNKNYDDMDEYMDYLAERRRLWHGSV